MTTETGIIMVTVAGEPVGKGRPRFSSAGSFVRAYTPKKTVSFENLVRIEYGLQTNNYRFLDDDMLDLRIIAYFPIPKSTSKKKREMMRKGKIRPAKKPDADNILKAVADALNTVAYKDDRQIVDTRVRKIYSETPRTVILIKKVTGV